MRTGQDTMKEDDIMKRMRKGFTLVEIMIVVAIIGILVGIAVPGFIKARHQAQGKSCNENLAKIDGAKEQYALENRLTTGDSVAIGDLVETDGSGYLKTTPKCPGGGGDGSGYPAEIGDIGEDGTPMCPLEDVTNADNPLHSLTQ